MSAFLSQIQKAREVGEIRRILQKHYPTKLSDRELLALIDEYWKFMHDAKVQEDIPLFISILNQRSSRRYFWAALMISVAALTVSIVALFRPSLPL